MAVTQTLLRKIPGLKDITFHPILPRVRIRTQIVVATVLSLAILAAATVAWTRAAFLNREMELVREKHLLLAEKLSLSLDRYILDVVAIFDHAADTYGGQEDAELLETVKISAVRYYDQQGAIEFEYNPNRRDIPYEVVADQMVKIEASGQGATSVISDLVNNNADAFFVIVRKTTDGGFAAGRLELDYIRALQASIRFGELGHSAIFDKRGFTIAHPIKSVEDGGMNASGISIVQQMMAGKTGVETFYSPPMKKDMIAGFTAVSSTGWGIMVPQPIEEIIMGVNRASFGAFMVVLIFLILATLVGLVLARSISGPIERLADFSARIADNEGSVSDNSVVSKPYTSYEMEYLRQALMRLIEHFRRSDRKLRTALDIEERESKFKDNFLIAAGHELKNPLNGVSGMLAVASEKNKDKDIARFLGIASNSAKMMNHIIEEMLVFSGEQRENKPLYLEPVLLKDFCTDLAEVHSRYAQEKGLIFNKEFNFPRRVRIETDRTKLSQVLSNLLNNALKYTNEGEIYFGVTLRELPGKPESELCFVIRDTGIGISKENKQRVFDPFFQADSSYSRSYNGLGLGLSIVRQLCERLQGSVELESDIGKGTTATLIIPVRVQSVSS
jgi:signal transduction histidine kinase